MWFLMKVLFYNKLIIPIIIAVGVLAVIAVDQIIAYSGRRNITAASEIHEAQAAIVLGAYVTPDGQLCDMLADRVKTGVDLYKANKVKKLLMTGDHGKESYDEVNNMRKFAESLGVPKEDIFMDHAGFSTYESMYRAKEIFKVHSAIIVTQKFHLPRAVYIAKKLGIDAKGVEADRHVYIGQEVYRYREVLARFKAFVQVNITHSKPTFLGAEIPIGGDGRSTHDMK